jgi:hypothetical protein
MVDNNKRYWDGLLYSLRCLSVCPHRRTYPNLVDYTYIKLEVFIPGTQKWWCKFCPKKSKKPKKKTGFWGIFSHFLTQKSSDLEICHEDLWTLREKVLDNTSVDHFPGGTGLACSFKRGKMIDLQKKRIRLGFRKENTNLVSQLCPSPDRTWVRPVQTC